MITREVASAPDLSALLTSSGFTVRMFGPMQVLVNGQALPRLRSRKALWLLALLTLRANKPVSREWIASTLWPDIDQSQGFANLRPVVSELRSALEGESERLQSPDRRTLLLDLAAANIDVLAFDAALASAQAGGKMGRLEHLEQAVALYQGPLLEGVTEEWVGQERDAREQGCLQALQTLAEAAAASGDHATTLNYWQRAASLAPLWDAARRGEMEALAHQGDSNAALQIYREFAQQLRHSDPTATPDEKTTALYQRLRTQARQRAHALQPTPIAPHGTALLHSSDKEETPPPPAPGYLPHPLTELVGREDERQEVLTCLRRSRLVTLIGLGGIGKTRLAIEVAGALAAEYPDGVWMVAMEALSDPYLVPQAIAQVLGLKERSGRPLLQTLAEELRGKRLLLVLDNCEHLLEASAQVVGHLLQQCAGMRILATSREALGITGELAWAVPALAVPELGHLPTGRATLLRVLSGYESVQLFVERAQAVQKTFALTSGNALTVGQICSQLGGIPLAIELAAARVKALTVEQIAVRLQDHLGSLSSSSPLSLLTGGSRTALSRQQTLRGALDWSYALLNERERLLLPRLSVFAGGWDLEAAESICVEGEIPTEAMLDLLTSLVDKSLVVFEERAGDRSGGRYRLLELVRQYGAEKLLASGEREAVRARHRDWFVSLVEKAEPHLSGGEQGVWLQRLETEHDNLRTTLVWEGAEAQQAASDLRLAGALYRFWYMHGYLREGREHLSRILGQQASQSRTAERAKALNAVGALSYSQGDYDAARTQSQESLSICRESGDQEGIAASLNNLGNVAYDQGDYATARTLHEESLSIRRELGDRQGIAWSLNSLGNIAHPQGEYAEARALYEESLNLFRELGDQQGTGRSLSCIGYVAFDQGDYAAASMLHEASLNLFRELGDRGGIAWAFCCLGYVAFDQSDYAAARPLLEEGLRLFREVGDRRGVAWALNSLGNVARPQGEYATARILHEESLSIRRELGDRQGIAWSLVCLGYVAYDQREYALARALLKEGLCLFQDLGDRKGVAETLGGLATVMLAQAEPVKAVRLWGAGHALREGIGAAQSPRDHEKHTQQMEQARRTLGADVFTANWEEGHILSWEQVVSGVLAEPEQT